MITDCFSSLISISCSFLFLWICVFSSCATEAYCGFICLVSVTWIVSGKIKFFKTYIQWGFWFDWMVNSLSVEITRWKSTIYTDLITRNPWLKKLNSWRSCKPQKSFLEINFFIQTYFVMICFFGIIFDFSSNLKC